MHSFVRRISAPEEWAARMSVSPHLLTVILALIVGLLSGAGAVLFRYMVRTLHAFFFTHNAFLFSPDFHLAVVIYPAIGGLLVGLLVYFFLSGESGHGVAAVMESVALSGGRFPPLAAFLRVLGSVLTLGSGGSAGPEDPSVQIGAAFGSGIGQLMHLPDDYVRTLVAAGSAAGIASAFHAPIAGVFFALEIVLGELSTASFGAVVIAAVASTAITQAWEGSLPEFVVAAYSFTSYWEFLFYLGLGFLAAIVSVLYIQSITLVGDYWHHVTLPVWLKPALGGLVVGAIGFFMPMVMGVGYDSIDAVLQGHAPWAVFFLLLIVVVKIFTTATTLGSGGIGGMFAPSLFLGAMLGGAYGMALQHFFPTVTSSPVAYAMVGMAAVLAGSVHSPITAMILLFEMTRDYRIILPLMFATVLSTLISQHIFRYSVYTLALFREGIHLERSPAVDVTQGVKVWEVMTEEVDSVSPQMTLQELKVFFENTWHHGAPVIDDDGKLVGIVTRKDLLQAIQAGRSDQWTVDDIANKKLITVCAEDAVWVALKRMSEYDIGRLPVVDCRNRQHLVGMIRRADIVKAYRLAISRRREKEDVIEEMRLAHLADMKLLRMEVKKDTPAAYQQIKDLDLPSNCLLAVVSRGGKRLMVHGDLKLLPGDKVVAIVSTDKRVEQALRKLFVIEKKI